MFESAESHRARVKARPEMQNSKRVQPGFRTPSTLQCPCQRSLIVDQCAAAGAAPVQRPRVASRAFIEAAARRSLGHQAPRIIGAWTTRTVSLCSRDGDTTTTEGATTSPRPPLQSPPPPTASGILATKRPAATRPRATRHKTPRLCSPKDRRNVVASAPPPVTNAHHAAACNRCTMGEGNQPPARSPCRSPTPGTLRGT